MPRDYVFKPVTRADYPMLRDWLALPHVRMWWGDPEYEISLIEEEIDGDLCDMRVVCADAPFAFVQDYPAKAYGSPQYGYLPDDARGIDTFLGDPAYLGRGHAAAYLKARATQLLDAGAPVVVVDPDPKNTRAIAAYQRAGFVPGDIFPGDDGDPVLVMEMKPRGAKTAARGGEGQFE